MWDRTRFWNVFNPTPKSLNLEEIYETPKTLKRSLAGAALCFGKSKRNIVSWVDL